MREFRLVEHDLRPGCRDIQVEGDLDLAVAKKLAAAIRRGVDHDVVLVDLQDCDFIDSTAIAVIVQAYRERTENGKRFAVYGATRQVDRVLSISGLSNNGLVFENCREVLRSVDRD